MTLYVSNPSKQHVTFHYRLASNLLASAEIPSGQQIALKISFADKDKVIEQLHRFGARDAAESHGNMGKFLGLLYRDEFVVDSDEIRMAHAAMVETQEKRSAAEATRGALAFDLNANRGTRNKRLARVTQVEVEQQLEPHARPSGNEVAFSLSVDPDGRQDVKLPA